MYSVATAPTVYGIETGVEPVLVQELTRTCCNSTYRLRY